MSVQGDELVVASPFGRRTVHLQVALSDIRQVELQCGFVDGLMLLVTGPGDDVMLDVSSWRRIVRGFRILGFTPHRRASYPDRYLIVPASRQPDWANLDR